MELEYAFLFVAVITSIKLVFIALQRDNLLLMMDLLETGDPKKWMDSKYFKPILIWILISTMFIFSFLWLYFENNGWF